ncbi:four-helix bundle copper-binding protein [Litoribacter alkaliphilus]|uniref:Four-helix bundle copper-binding protein n=1 Tax=Litoribacter ruber TaxID=702568 RepID=A0AAP2CIP3_9BACT|nr:four-helix bundle copper-binding protein [Litoribacter alkaliphilus]MBS9525463.1 four-helix bundle copper-binding protein [Litoribacter alkaliphilus]
MNHQDLIQKLAVCAAACEHCMDSCLSEDNVQHMVACIKTDRDCAKICQLTASFVASGSRHAQHLIKECIEICNECAAECEKHDHDHCKQCAKACRECVEACKSYQTAQV